MKKLLPFATKKLVIIGMAIFSGSTILAQAIDSSHIELEAPQELRDGVLYSTLVKVKTISGVFSGVSYTAKYVGTSCISAGHNQFKLILENAVLENGGDPAEIEFERSDIETKISSSKVTNIYRIWFPVKVNTNKIVADLRMCSSIELACPPYSIVMDNSSSYFDLGTPYNAFPNWHVDKIQAPSAWVFMQNSGNGVVAITDIGLVRSTHDEFQIGGVVNAPYSTECGAFGNHATEVGSVIAAKPATAALDGPISVGNGQILVNSHSLEIPCGPNNAFTEIYNLSPRPRILSLSYAYRVSYLGIPAGAPNYQINSSYADCQLDLVVLEQLISEGMIVYASTGNQMWQGSGICASGTCTTTKGIGYPYGLPGITGVGATANNYSANSKLEYGMGSGIQSWTTASAGYSSGGNWNYNYNGPILQNTSFAAPVLPNTIDVDNQNQGYLEITAPGRYIDVATSSSNTSITMDNGTSFSAPMVATVAASMLAVNTSLSNSQVYNILMNSADKVNYNPNGLELSELNSNVSYTKGYKYFNNGDINNGGFFNQELDYVMGYGRVNMLSAVMNAAGLNTGGFTINNSLASGKRKIWVENVNDHSYLTMPYDESYEYDAVLNQNGALITFDGTSTSPDFPEFELKSNSTFRITNNAKMEIKNGAKLTLQNGTYGKITKFIVQTKLITGLGGILELKDNIFNIPSNTLLEIDAGSILTIDNAELIVQLGGCLHIKNGATLNITGAALGKITAQTGSYLCIESGALVNIVLSANQIDIASGVFIGLHPSISIPGSCQNPCDIVYSGSGSIIYSASCIVFNSGTVILNESCSLGSDGSITISVSGGSSPYTYNINGGTFQTSNAFSALPAGSYSIGVMDAMGNSTFASFSVFGPLPMTLSMSQISPNCFGGLNGGTATVTVAGGSSPFTYLWNNGQTTQTATGLLAGVYNVTVTDAANCTANISVTITNSTSNPPFTSIVTSSTSVSCYGGSNGSASISTTGGPSSYTIYWSNLGGSPFSNAVTITGRPAGTYSVLLVDFSSGCTSNQTVVINQPADLIISTTVSDASGCTSNDGSATANQIGGTAPFTYSWNTSPIQTTQTATGLSPGIYTVTVTDANLCVKTAIVAVGNSASILTLSLTVNNITCDGFNNGSITANVTGGSPPYTYAWNTSQFTSSVTNLSAGNYAVTVTDAIGNCQSILALISNPSPINTNVTINPACIGSISTVTTGGTPPYSYIWNTSPVQTTSTAVDLPAGIYTVTVTDANGCIGTYAPSANTGFAMLQPMSIIVSKTDAASCTSPTGTATVSSILNGNPPYLYNWSDGQTTPTAINLVPGVYTVTVTGAPPSSCSATATVTVNAANGPLLSTSQTNVSCPGGPNNGTASVSAIGGTAPYTYLWSPGGQTTSSISGLGAGSYNVTVTDALGLCNVANITINLEELVISVIKTDGSCTPGNDGTATVNGVLGGIGPYTYLWNTTPSQTNQTATGLSPGVYSVIVTDASGCTGTEDITISTPGIGIALTKADVTCFGGSNGAAYFWHFTNFGTPPYSFLWSPGGQTGASISGQVAGNYSLTITDADGCSSTTSISINEPTPIILTATSLNTSCGSPNGVASVSVSGGSPPFSYSWNSTPIQNTQTATGLAPGSYIVTVTDASGCLNTASVTIGASSNPVVTIASTDVTCNDNGSATASVIDGLGPYTYLWNDPGSQTSQAAIGLTAGSYTVTVTDALGCVATATTIINNSIIYDYPSGLILSSNVTWSGGTIKVNGNIVIPDGRILTVNSGAAIEFAENSGIIIESGGIMNLSGASVLRSLSSCNIMWDGVTVNGNISSGDFGGTLIINNATIKDAHIGVNALWGTFVFNWTYTGTVQAIAANFINNRIGIKMEGRDFARSTSSINSLIASCMFTCDAPLLDAVTYSGEGTENFIQLESVRELNINNNVFTGNTSFSADKRGAGISALNSNFIADGNNQFVNLTRGVESGVTDIPRQITIDANTFTNTQNGIYIQSGELDIITNNTFNIPAPSVPFTESYGLFLVTTSGFNIEANTFNAIGSDPNTYGMAFENTGATGGVVFKNTINANLGYGIQAQQNNSNLKVRCNTFATPLNYSLAVVNMGPTSTLKQQGASCLTDQDPAGNEWTTPGACSFPEQDVFADLGVTFKYYSHDFNASGFDWTKPLCSTTAWKLSDMTPYICTGLSKDPVTSCSTSIAGFLAPPPNTDYIVYFAAIKDRITDYYTKIDALKLQVPSVSASMDGGNKQSLLNAIYDPAISAGQLKYTLTHSGPLSDEILIAAIEGPPLPMGILKEVLYPQAPLSVDVLTSLENYSLPSGIRNDIYNAQTNPPNYTKLSDLLGQIEYWRGEIALLESEYQRHFLVYNEKVCKRTCKDSRSIDSKMLLVEAYFSENKLDSARTVLSEISLADATVVAEIEKQNYVDYMNVLFSLADNALNVKQMDAPQVSIMQQIAGSNTKAGSKAEIAMQVAANQKTVHAIADIQTSHSMLVLDQDSIDDIKGLKAKLYPNPNNGTMSFEYSLQDNENGEFSIYDVTGREIANYVLLPGNKIITVTETSLDNGIYFYIYKVNDIIEKSEKVVIIK